MDQNKKKENRRKKVLIEPDSQLKCALTVIISMISYSLLLGFIVFFPLYLEMDASSENLEHLEWITTLVLQLHQRLWPAVIIVAMAMGVQSIYASHRVLGPSFQLKKNIKEFIRGNFVTTKLRKKDQLKEIELALNELGNTLTKVTRSNGAFHRYLRDELISISETLEKKDDRDSSQTVNTLRHLIEKLGNHTSMEFMDGPSSDKIENEA